MMGRTPNTSLPLAMREGVSTRCHLPRVGAREGSLGSWAGGSDGLGSLGAWGPLFLLMGIGWGSICLGKPLKNQAPERFQTWGVEAVGWHPCLRGMLGAGLAAFTPPRITGIFLQQATPRTCALHPTAPQPLLLIY